MLKTLQYLSPVSALVASRLEAHGWKRESGSAIASKSYETDSGKQQVHVYLSDWGNQSRSFMLTGDVWSRGAKSPLPPMPTLIPKGGIPGGDSKCREPVCRAHGCRHGQRFGNGIGIK